LGSAPVGRSTPFDDSIAASRLAACPPPTGGGKPAAPVWDMLQYPQQRFHIRETAARCGIHQSMNSEGGRCHDNARCESIWARMKTELIYDRCDPGKMTVEELKSLVWRYFLGYWNNRRICSANDGLPPPVKRQRFYDSLYAAG